MNILVATSEAVPFAKTGGLADVCGALPIELARLGHQPTVILPAYRQTGGCGLPIEPMGIDFIVPIGSKMVTGHLLRSTIPGVNVPVYLVQQDQYFDREQLYHADGKDYADNCERFVFFSRAVLEAIRLLDLQVDVLHANDWQTGLIPAYLKIEYRLGPALPADRQPVYGPQHFLSGTVLALGHAADRARLEVFQLAADGVPRHAELVEDRDGLRRLHQHRQPALCPGNSDAVPWAAGWKACCSTAATCFRAFSTASTRTNGTRPRIRICRPTTTSTSVAQGKPRCKAALQKELGLPQDPRRRWWAWWAGLTDQKGLDLVADVMQRWVQTSDVQWVILGTGQPKYHKLLGNAGRALPAEGGRSAWSSPIRWPIGSRRGPTCS